MSTLLQELGGGSRPEGLSLSLYGKNHCPTAGEMAMAAKHPSGARVEPACRRGGLGERAPCPQAASPPLRQALGGSLEKEPGEEALSPQLQAPGARVSAVEACFVFKKMIMNSRM